MKTTPKIPEIREDERTPLVMVLLEIIQILQEQIQELRDEIARLKGQKPKPNIKPSVLEKYFENKGSLSDITKRPGSAKRQKTDNLEIHETVIVKAENVPQGSTFRAMRNLQYRTWCSSHIIRSIAGSDGKLRKVTQLWHRFRRRSRQWAATLTLRC